MPPAALGIAGLVVSAIGVMQQRNAARDEADARARQAEIETRRADLQAAREARQAVRQARIARGVVINQGANANTSQSSGVQGGASSIQSQLDSNLTYLDNSVGLAREYASESVKVGQAQASEAEWGAIGQLGGTVFGAAGGFRTIFGGNK